MHSALIHKIFKNTNCVSMDEFIRSALYDYEYGYYMNRMPFGATGDFITAAEISQLFGEIIAVWVLYSWEKIGFPSKFALVELGPGRGTLMSDIVRTLQNFDECFKALDIHLIEISPMLCEIQKHFLKNYQVFWHKDITTIPELPVLFIANEVFDALPIKQFVYDAGIWKENYVELKNNTLQVVQKDTNFIFDIASVMEGSVIEISDDGRVLLTLMENKIVKYGGAGIIIDYGYTYPPPYVSTIQSVKNHQYNFFLKDIGKCDITAHVDFSFLQNNLQKVKSSIITQREFLYYFGIKERLKILMNHSTKKQQQELKSAFLRLTENMGTLFKVLMINYVIKEY
ncbi:SAM-dependent methyltransferase [Neoehrlichia mikurensis]|uniref:SAM-dependent methyltransferase n=1 Tax=Neoehrlichia mikurensis TaxID=89586 RepID=A0A9Q9BUF6_9RICK|nr:SAM-dependent methyltransferase [Neoehrlichia mikurensis]QXK92053.1 SAM-dependent methyltransferase [Neoehrlichia mikurensis]QXK92510.1 SAM-dependent methyltransferase [Neoehrlichia mikurensis]QXK93746.1 SAM-dependent methyltransferase [Neoehrlichia mikurensis]UTO55283.1 SAM-dependent methyltransferase [Neoehrlichia mikurensis]UTO56203.1 SAM-dependent methyltransferase [Neoehrlichia mikurensis]